MEIKNVPSIIIKKELIIHNEQSFLAIEAPKKRKEGGTKKNFLRQSGGNKERGTVFYLKHQSSIVLLETQATSKPLHATCHNDNDTTMRCAMHIMHLDWTILLWTTIYHAYLLLIHFQLVYLPFKLQFLFSFGRFKHTVQKR